MIDKTDLESMGLYDELDSINTESKERDRIISINRRKDEEEAEEERKRFKKQHK